jgi:histone deacetylase complex regulatory component SIN3
MFVYNDTHIVLNHAWLAGESVKDDNDNAAFENQHTEFLALVQRLVTNKMDSAAFEDACRGMLGTNGYVLFTLDKLVSKVMKLVQSMLAERVDYPVLFKTHHAACSR